MGRERGCFFFFLAAADLTDTSSPHLHFTKVVTSATDPSALIH